MAQYNSQKPKTSWITVGILLIAVAGLLLFTQRGTLREIYSEVQSSFEEPLPQEVTYETIRVNKASDPVVENEEPTVETPGAQEAPPEPVVLPSEFLLDVPFTTQAPDANWDLPYQEACEEASAITVHYFYQEKTFTKEIADKEILALVDFQNEYLGFYKDTTAEETANAIQAYWGYSRVDVIDNPLIDTIKQHVYEGRPVIVPAAGKQLENPNFRNGGPPYHMFVVRGWDSDEFITNDVGTRNGENYRYSYDTVMTAMHDWNGGDVENGAKRIIVIYPEQ